MGEPKQAEALANNPIKNDYLINLIASRRNKPKEEVAEEMMKNIENMSDNSQNQINISNFDDISSNPVV